MCTGVYTLRVVDIDEVVCKQHLAPMYMYTQQEVFWNVHKYGSAGSMLMI